MDALLTVAETPEYLRRADRLLSGAEQAGVVEHLAANPRTGDLIRGTGGVRKLRWARGARGKSGGVRVIYYWWEAGLQFWLYTLYDKDERDDLSPQQRKTLQAMLKAELEARRKA